MPFTRTITLYNIRAESFSIKTEAKTFTSRVISRDLNWTKKR